MYRKLILTLFAVVVLFSCEEKESIKEGTFKLYEKDKFIGTIGNVPN